MLIFKVQSRGEISKPPLTTLDLQRGAQAVLKARVLKHTEPRLRTC